MADIKPGNCHFRKINKVLILVGVGWCGGERETHNAGLCALFKEIWDWVKSNQCKQLRQLNQSGALLLYTVTTPDSSSSIMIHYSETSECCGQSAFTQPHVSVRRMTGHH